MAESILKDLYPLFEENSTRISPESLDSFRKKHEGRIISSEVLQIALKELQNRQQVDRITLLTRILHEANDEEVRRATIQELVRLKSSELTTILAGWLRSHQTNSPAKVEAIRALGKAAIRRYLDRR